MYPHQTASLSLETDEGSAKTYTASRIARLKGPCSADRFGGVGNADNLRRSRYARAAIGSFGPGCIVNQRSSPLRSSNASPLDGGAPHLIHVSGVEAAYIRKKSKKQPCRRIILRRRPEVHAHRTATLVHEACRRAGGWRGAEERRASPPARGATAKQ